MKKFYFSHGFITVFYAGFNVNKTGIVLISFNVYQNSTIKAPGLPHPPPGPGEELDPFYS
jgi:hypothetical protein